MATEHTSYPWMFTRTYRGGIPEIVGHDRILDIDLSDHKWPVEAFKHNEAENTLIVRTFKSEDKFCLWIFRRSGEKEYSQLRKIGRNENPDKFYQWFKDNTVGPEFRGPHRPGKHYARSTTT